MGTTKKAMILWLFEKIVTLTNIKYIATGNVHKTFSICWFRSDFSIKQWG